LALRFILGRAGSGKTHYCLEAIARELRETPDGAPLILLVPEQATFQMDRALVSMPGVRAAVRAQVLSFHRLAWRVLSETGGAARPHIDEVGKVMALRALLGRRRDELRMFASIAGRAGFLDQLAQTLSELAAYGITPEQLQEGYEVLEALGRGDTALAAKLHDLALIGRDLREYLSGRWVDPDDYLGLLASKLATRPGCVTGARVWVDGFAGFTPQELAVLGALLKVAGEVNVALCLDPEDLGAPRDGSSTFHPTLKTYDALLDLAARVGAERAEPVKLTEAPRFASAPALAHLEREYPRFRPRPFGLDPAECVTVVAAETRRAEVLAAAKEMVRLARKEGYRWRDMSVIVRSPDLYADLLQSTLAEFGIPFFLDHRRPLSYHPLVEFVRSAVETALTGWAAEPLFRLLKTDFWPLSRDEVDLLENYVLAHGVRGKAWTQDAPWMWRRLFSIDETAPPDPAAEAELQRIDALRRKVADLLGPFVARVAGDAGGRAARAASRTRLTVRGLAEALWDLIERLDVPGTLETWRLRAVKAGSPEVAQAHERAFDGFTGLLDQMVENLAAQRVSLPEFLSILSAGLETLRPGLVPPRLDQVMVGAIDRSRQPDIKACFVLGANDGVFPAGSSEDVIFSDREREELRESYAMDLSPSARERAFNEDYYVYIALTRPSERLWVSYARADDSGRALAPSPLLARVMAAFPALAARNRGRSPAGLEPGAEEVFSEAEALAAVTRVLADLRRSTDRGDPARPLGTCRAWLEIYNWLVADEERRRRTEAALRAVSYRNEAVELESGLMERLLGKVRQGPEPDHSEVSVSCSISRLEDYARCPFSHFARAALGLETRPRRQVRAPEIGSYYHAVLSVFTRELKKEGLDLARLGPEEIAALLDRAVQEVRPRLESDVLASTAHYRYLGERLKRTMARTVEVLGEHARRSAFRPVGAELRFRVPAVSRTASGGPLDLVGIIDRLEAAEASGRVYVRVVDFKSTARGFDVRRTCEGLDLQLPAYLLAATHPRVDWPGGTGPGLPPGQAVPAGAFLFPVTDPFVSAEGPLPDEDVQRERMRLVRMQGVLVAEEDVLRLMDRSGASSDTPILPVTYTSTGKLWPSKAALTREQMDLLISFARRKVEETAGRLLRGRIEISPVSLKPGDIACTYCDYRPLCGFDPSAGDKPRRVPPRKPDEAWKLIGRQAKEGEPDHGS